MESTTPKKPIVGCYVVGGESICLSEDIPDVLYCGSEDYLTYFKTACKKLDKKLECLVIVDHLLNEPELFQEMYEIAKEYASVIHIIPAVVAILQRVASHTCIILSEKILVLIRIDSKYLSFILEKDGFLLSPIEVQMNSLKSLQNPEYSEFSSKPVFCVYGKKMEDNIVEQLGTEFPKIKIYFFKNQMKTLAVGGFYKAQCIAEPGKHLEVANFTTGLLYGINPLVNPCSKFPLKLHFLPSVNETIKFGDSVTIKVGSYVHWLFKQVSLSKVEFDPSLYYLLEYDEFGLMKIQEAVKDPFDIFYNVPITNQNVQVWSNDREKMGCFNFGKKFIQFSPLTQDLKSVMDDEWLNDEAQVVRQLKAIHCDLVTVFVDHKLQNYKNGPIISVAPSYIGILQYCLSFFTPSKSKLAFFVVTKIDTKFFVLSQRSPYCYTVTYCTKLSETYIDESILCGFEDDDDLGLFYLSEKGSKRFLFFDQNFNHKIIRHEIEEVDELYGGAIYALQNSSKCLETVYVTVDPYLDPEENVCDELATVSKRTSTSFYEIEAFFHGALKLLELNSTTKKLFYGDLIAILIRKYSTLHIFFFVHVKGKYLFKYNITVPASQLITPTILHFADIVIVGFSFGRIQLSDKIIPCYFAWPVSYNVEQFLEALNNDQLLIFDTLPYAEAITKAVGNKIYETNIYQKCTMAIEFSENSCKIVLDNDEYVAVSGGMLLKDSYEHIPMYLSFCRSPPRIGSDAMEDLQNFPDSVVYDFFKLLGTTSETFPASDYDFNMLEMDNSDNPKLGYNFKNSEGEYQIMSPEMAMKIYFQKLIFLYEKYSDKNVDEIKLISESAFSNIQKECILKIGQELKKEFIFSRY